MTTEKIYLTAGSVNCTCCQDIPSCRNIESSVDDDDLVAAKLAAAEKMADGLQRIAETHYAHYKDGPYISDHDSGYKMGVVAGHRLAATWAREALAEWQKAGE